MTCVQGRTSARGFWRQNVRQKLTYVLFTTHSSRISFVIDTTDDVQLVLAGKCHHSKENEARRAQGEIFFTCATSSKACRCLLPNCLNQTFSLIFETRLLKCIVRRDKTIAGWLNEHEYSYAPVTLWRRTKAKNVCSKKDRQNAVVRQGDHYFVSPCLSRRSLSELWRSCSPKLSARWSTVEQLVTKTLRLTAMPCDLQSDAFTRVASGVMMRVFLSLQEDRQSLSKPTMDH
jgi:hypothetical protein